MAICKFCNALMSWGQAPDGRFIPLIPLGDEGEADRDYQDGDGILRSTHRLVCTNKAGPLVQITKLARNVRAKDVLPAMHEHVAEVLAKKAAKRRKKK